MIYSLERLPGQAFQTFLATLHEHRGEFLEKVSEAISGPLSELSLNRDAPVFAFERMHRHQLSQADYDSPHLVSTCRTLDHF